MITDRELDTLITELDEVLKGHPRPRLHLYLDALLELKELRSKSIIIPRGTKVKPYQGPAFLFHEPEIDEDDTRCGR